MIAFTVEGDPQGKGRHRSGQGRQYTPARTVRYERVVRAVCLDSMRRHGQKVIEAATHVAITVRFGIPKSTSKRLREQMLSGAVRPVKKPDADNVAKAICDSLNGVAFFDDSQVSELHVSRVYAASPGVDVRIWAIAGSVNEGVAPCLVETSTE